jgi:hypothetical protein
MAQEADGKSKWPKISDKKSILRLERKKIADMQHPLA